MKNKYILFGLVCTLFFSTSTLAQKKKSANKAGKKNDKDQYSYNILRNDPEHGKNFSLIFDPVYINIDGLNLNFGYDLGLNYCYDNKFGLSAKFFHSYLEATERTPNVSPVSTNPFTMFDANIYYTISSETSPSEEPITVKQVGRVNYYVNVPGKMLTTKSIRLGYMHVNTYAAGNISYSGYDVKDPTKHVQDLQPFASMMDASIIFVGVARSKSHDMKVNFKNYGEKGSASAVVIYADLMYAPTITYSDGVQFISGAGTPRPDQYITYHINDNTPKFPVGARIGIVNSGLGTFDWRVGAEGGVRPAPDPLSGLYILVNVGMGLNFKI